MPDTTDATARAVKLTDRDVALLRECIRYDIMDDGGGYLRLGGHGYAPIRYNRASMPSLERRGIVKYCRGYWTATDLGRAHPAARPRPDAATN